MLPILVDEKNEWFAKPVLSILATCSFMLALYALPGVVSANWWKRAFAIAGVPLMMGWVFHVVFDIFCYSSRKIISRQA